MKKFLNFIMIAGIATWAVSCVEPVEPTNPEMLVGQWSVSEYYVDGQTSGSGVFGRFILERDNSFFMEDINGLSYTGEWAELEDELTLTVEDGSTFVYSIVFLNYTKMQMVQTIASPTAGTIEIRYLLNRSNATTY